MKKFEVVLIENKKVTYVIEANSAEKAVNIAKNQKDKNSDSIFSKKEWLVNNVEDINF